MAGQRVTEVVAWFAEESEGAPAALRERARRYLERQDGHEDPAEALAAAAIEALRATLARPGDRAVALDLLSADALVTLALKARAASAPHDLGKFAAKLTALGAGVR